MGLPRPPTPHLCKRFSMVNDKKNIHFILNNLLSIIFPAGRFRIFFFKISIFRSNFKPPQKGGDS
jgi:hypothetical protein